MSIRDVYIVDAVRTPIGKFGGALASVRPDDLAAHGGGARRDPRAPRDPPPPAPAGATPEGRYS
ncbi:hypothetical protein ACFU8I_17415, partial [Streptomyces sp. NPDC057540]